MRKVQSRLAALIDAHNLKVSESGGGNRLTQKSLAKQVDVAATTIHRLYNNTARRFDADVLEKVCNFFGCELGDLLILREDVSND